MDQLLILNTWNRIQMDKNPFKPDRIQIRSGNIRTIYIPSSKDLTAENKIANTIKKNSLVYLILLWPFRFPCLCLSVFFLNYSIHSSFAEAFHCIRACSFWRGLFWIFTCRMLVYEYVNNGNLEQWLHGVNQRGVLSWENRMKILLGTAKA